MKNRMFLLVLTTLLFSALPLLSSNTKGQLYPVIPGDGPEAVDGTHLLPEREMELRNQAANRTFFYSMRTVEKQAVIGDEITLSIGDFHHQNSYDETFKVVMIGTNGIILITKDAYNSFDGTGYHFANPVGDGSTKFKRTEDVLTTDQLTYLLNEFDTNIYPNDTAVFGEPAPRGADGKKIWILLHNIKDESYYQDGSESYVAGYFSAGEDLANNKNMMHIDTYDWINRIGKDAESPYLYESTFAHELEHLIHFDQDADEPSWIDEGLANLAGYICGYGHPRRHIAYYLLRHPTTPLTFWGGGLEDYGASYLFALYMYEKFGGNAFVTSLIKEQANGIEGVNNTLKAYGYMTDFNEVFNNWAIATYLDDSTIGQGQFGYETLEMGSADSLGYTLSSMLDQFYHITAYTVPFDLTSDWAGINPMPYTVHYVPFNNEVDAELTFDGDDFVGVTPPDGALEWYSGVSAWAWRSISRDFDIPATGAKLNFQLFYEIENNWDYGYVEVYSHTTNQWYTLAADGLTTTTLPNAQDNTNTPVEREPSTYFANGRWNAFTGNSNGWQNVTMDLTPFAGQRISLYFTTWQDGASTLQMMYVDNIKIDAIGFVDSAETGNTGWVMDQWEITDGKKDNNYGVTTLETLTVPTFDAQGVQNGEKVVLLDIEEMEINPATEKGAEDVDEAPANSGYKNITIISNMSDHILPSGYIFKIRNEN